MLQEECKTEVVSTSQWSPGRVSGSSWRQEETTEMELVIVVFQKHKQ